MASPSPDVVMPDGVCPCDQCAPLNGHCCSCTGCYKVPLGSDYTNHSGYKDSKYKIIHHKRICNLHLFLEHAR